MTIPWQAAHLWRCHWKSLHAFVQRQQGPCAVLHSIVAHDWPTIVSPMAHLSQFIAENRDEPVCRCRAKSALPIDPPLPQ
jgi:hypothetical protein